MNVILFTVKSLDKFIRLYHKAYKIIKHIVYADALYVLYVLICVCVRIVLILGCPSTPL